MKVSVLLPTYSRPQELRRCLEALASQTARPHEVVLVVRDKDEATRDFLASYDPGPLSLRVLPVTEPGLVAALNVGLAGFDGEIVAMTDDDAVPRPDWVERIRSHFENDPALGGLGGRDWMYNDGILVTGSARRVGRVSWFGRPVGNHHLGVGPPREVEILKGVNMSFRRTAIEDVRFDRRLKGRGTEMHNEWSVCTGVRRRGWKLVYDPLLAVDHYLAARPTNEDRLHRSADGVYEAVYNETLLLLEFLPPARRLVFIVWSWLVGTRLTPGLVQIARAKLHGRAHALQTLRAGARARVDAWRTYRGGRAP
jgi:glycosyltransferase involved in cell wall biosynthesis